MPRQPRLEAEGLLYHVMARGIEKRRIFTFKSDYDFFLERFGEIAGETSTICLAFCLLPNHFHLLIRSSEIPLSTVMRRLLTGYAVVYNKRHGRVGHLFQNRYKAIVCQEESYLFELIKYIHLNPVRAGLVGSMNELNAFPYSGHAAISGNRQFFWYAPEMALGYFSSDKASALQAYRTLITDGWNAGRDRRFSGGGLKRSLGFPEVLPAGSVMYDERVLGDSDFVMSLLEGREGMHSESKDIDVDALSLEPYDRPKSV